MGAPLLGFLGVIGIFERAGKTNRSLVGCNMLGVECGGEGLLSGLKWNGGM